MRDNARKAYRIAVVLLPLLLSLCILSREESGTLQQGAARTLASIDGSSAVLELVRIGVIHE